MQNEPCDSMDSRLSKYCYKSSLLDELREKGYAVHAVNYPADSDADKCNERRFLGHSVQMAQAETYEQYARSLRDAISAEHPCSMGM